MNLSRIELNAVLAGLRLLQQNLNLGGGTPNDPDVQAIWSDGLLTGMTDEAIDEFCDRINVQTEDLSHHVDRAKRIDALMDLHDEVLGEASANERDHTKLAEILADMMHWCSENKHDWHKAVALAQDHFLAETQG